jgi:plasmid stabilization system protein ParE
LPAYQLSKLARLDLIDIADYTVDTWGEEQAYRYLNSLEACFNRLKSAAPAIEFGQVAAASSTEDTSFFIE